MFVLRQDEDINDDVAILLMLTMLLPHCSHCRPIFLFRIISHVLPQVLFQQIYQVLIQVRIPVLSTLLQHGIRQLQLQNFFQRFFHQDYLKMYDGSSDDQILLKMLITFSFRYFF